MTEINMQCSTGLTGIVLTDEEGNSVVFKAVKDRDGSYRLIGKRDADIRSDCTPAKD